MITKMTCKCGDSHEYYCANPAVAKPNCRKFYEDLKKGVDSKTANAAHDLQVAK